MNYLVLLKKHFPHYCWSPLLLKLSPFNDILYIYNKILCNWKEAILPKQYKQLETSEIWKETNRMEDFNTNTISKQQKISKQLRWLLLSRKPVSKHLFIPLMNLQATILSKNSSRYFFRVILRNFSQ